MKNVLVYLCPEFVEAAALASNIEIKFSPAGEALINGVKTIKDEDLSANDALQLMRIIERDNNLPSAAKVENNIFCMSGHITGVMSEMVGSDMQASVGRYAPEVIRTFEAL